MKLTRLRLLGFKSFVEPTDFLIEPGLTGVVGPNGCGKSNLVEALRWVMGETSHKSMRAADMDDVIFSGNNSRPGRNNAEVGLRLDNTTRTAPAQFNGEDTLDVTRRIEREQGSTYRINGREVRARDVQILFADASTGARSPAMVHQGRIGEIINAKPEQRRRVLEEAAGISGLHARRHEAELRLNAAEQNLARLEDVIGQLAGQIDALKRQAKQAVRYRTVSQQVRTSEAMLFHLRYVNAQAETVEAVRAQDEALRLVAERTGAQAEASTRQANAAAALPDLRDAEARAAAALHRMVLARESLEREEARVRERIAELDRRLVQLADDIGRGQALVTDAQAALGGLTNERETLEREAATSGERRNEFDARIAAAQATLDASEQRLAELTGAVAQLAAQRGRLEQATRDHADRQNRAARELAGVDTELARLQAGGPADAALPELASAVAQAQSDIEAAEAATVRAEAAHSAARQALDVARQPLAEAERRVNRLDTEARTLAKVLHVDAKSMWPPVLDLLTVEKGFETALGGALGDDLDAPIDANAPLRWAGAQPDGDPSLPEGVDPLAAHVSAPPELARRLAQIGVVSRAEGPALARQLKPGQRLVSPEGDLWRWDGFWVAANAPTGAARRLAERNRLIDIERELESARADAETRRAAVRAAEAEVTTAAEAETQGRNRRRELQQAANAARERHTGAERELARTAARQSALGEAKTRLEAAVADAQAQHNEAASQLGALPALDGLNAELTEIKNRVAQDRSIFAEARAQAQALVREIELATRRITAIGTEADAWRERESGAAAQIALLEARMAETHEERTRLADSPAAFEAERRGLIDQIEAGEATRRAAADALALGETALAEADRAARAALEAMSTAREEQVRAEERHEAAKRRLADVGHEIQEVLEIEPEAVAAMAGIEPDTVLPDVADAEAQLERLRRERERLGAVNLRAEEELREVETQHTTLTAERDDLVEAIKRLRQGIQNLNREARERLVGSFKIVNEHFQQLFTRLFGGGTAELQLIESEDPLEAGLDILAKPPGKKPATLSLLSGGEQALTAMALIFAVFLTNPAPVCVLDEVDAPLDDHNVDRFCDLLDEMASSTQTRFVIITHNPITMARMNRLFGVTMAERGVSQLVSVDLEGAVKLREAV
jgi:chromosome segregation protein